MSSPLLYLAHPYSAPTQRARLRNVEKTMDAAIQLYYHGFCSICPNLFHFLDDRATAIGKPLQWLDYMVWDVNLLSRCDALLYLGQSKGTDIEKAWAEKHNLPVFYSIEAVIQHYRADNGTDIASLETDTQE
jgi:hypothetical protein